MVGLRATLALGIAIAAAPAWADGLAVRPGLWESSSSAAGGAPHTAMPQIPPDALARMTTEQQAMIRQRMAGGGGAPQTHKYCVTEAMIRKGSTGPGNEQQCTQTVVSNTASYVEVRVVCTGAHPANGTIAVRSVGDTTVEGTMDLTASDGRGGTMPIHSTFQSRWLGPDCGDVRPRE